MGWSKHPEMAMVQRRELGLVETLHDDHDGGIDEADVGVGIAIAQAADARDGLSWRCPRRHTKASPSSPAEGEPLEPSRWTRAARAQLLEPGRSPHVPPDQARGVIGRIAHRVRRATSE
jgi:hypothetical protein